MTKNDLVQAVVDKVGINKADAVLAVDVIFDEIIEGIMSGEIVKVRGFGNFVAVRRRERKGYNIHSKKVVTLPEKNVPKFSPGKTLQDSAVTAKVKYYEDGKPFKGETTAPAAPAAPAKPAAAPAAKTAAPAAKTAPAAPSTPVTPASQVTTKVPLTGKPAPAPTKAAAPAAAPAAAVPAAPAAAPGKIDYSADPEHDKAFRIARAFVSDLKAYHKDLVENAKKSGDFFKALDKQIKDMMHTYANRVPERVRNQRNYLSELLEALSKE